VSEPRIIASSTLPIGIFDSGFGGLSVLREIASLLPGEDLLYYGDNANAPYGDLDEKRIREVTLTSVAQLMDRGIKALVVACNTATSAAIEIIRSEFSLPVIGMEPAVKPAVQMRSRGKVLVLATTATLRQQKLHTLVERLGNPDYLVPFACPGLVELVERGVTSGPELDQFLSGLFAPLRGLDVQVVVLGCTHYVFVRQAIECCFAPRPLVVDGNQGTAANLVRELARHDLLRQIEGDRRGSVEFITTGERERCEPIFRRLMALPY
jgi:glutamate racemase